MTTILDCNFDSEDDSDYNGENNQSQESEDCCVGNSDRYEPDDPLAEISINNNAQCCCMIL